MKRIEYFPFSHSLTSDYACPLKRAREAASGANHMGRILSALLILVIALSHGSMGTATPHFGSSVHFTHESHYHGTSSAEASHDMPSITATGEQDSDSSSPAAGHHSHIAFDVAPNQTVALAERRFVKERQRPDDDSWLSSAAVMPLTEPPSA